MRILYVSPMPLPIENILKGKTQIEGFPAFYFPMRMLIDKGHRVDFVLLSNYDGPSDVRVDWFKPEWILENLSMSHTERGGVYRTARGVMRMFQLVRSVWRVTGSHQYDFIYAHGSMAAIPQVVGRFRRIPVGVRWYGDSNFCFRDIQRLGKRLAALKHPLDFANFRLPYCFFLVTDDHSFGDKVHEAWRAKKEPGPFLHWKTGIEMKDVGSCVSEVPVPEHEYIFFAGRFARWKRQDRLIETLRELHQAGRSIHLYFAGQLESGPSSEEYIEELRELVRRYDLENFVHFLGGVSQDTVRVLANRSTAIVIMHDIANIGNVFYETMSVGSVIVTTDDGSVRQFVEDGKNGFIVDDPVDAAKIIGKLLDDSFLAERIRQEARVSAAALFMSVDERFGREIELIERCASKPISGP